MRRIKIAAKPIKYIDILKKFCIRGLEITTLYNMTLIRINTNKIAQWRSPSQQIWNFLFLSLFYTHDTIKCLTILQQFYNCEIYTHFLSISVLS